MQSRWWIEDLHVLDGGQSISESGLIADAMQHAVVCVCVCVSVCLSAPAALLLLCCCFTAALLLLYCFFTAVVLAGTPPPLQHKELKATGYII
jgi:hypothetical protein